jgi:hypothetical protein
MANHSGSRGHSKRDPAVVAAWILGGLTIAGVVAGVLLTHALGGSPASTPTPTASAPATVTPSPGSAASSAPPASAAASGAITDPSNGATDVYKHEQLHVSGTARNVPAGYHLDVFLQFSGYQRYYAAANPDIAAPLISGHWSATIYIGDAGSIILWLVSLSPNQVNYVNSQVADQTAGYPTLPGTRLASVSFTATASP